MMLIQIIILIAGFISSPNFQVYDTGSKNGIIRVLCLKCIRKSMELMSKHLKIGYQQNFSKENPWNYPTVESVNDKFFFDNFYNNQTMGLNLRVNLVENKLTKKFYKNGMIYNKQVAIGDSNELFLIKVNQKMFIISKEEKKISYYDHNLYEIRKFKSILIKIACKSKYLNSHKNYWCGIWLESRAKIYLVLKKEQIKCEFIIKSVFIYEWNKSCIQFGRKRIKRSSYQTDESCENNLFWNAIDFFFGTQSGSENCKKECCKKFKKECFEKCKKQNCKKYTEECKNECCKKYDNCIDYSKTISATTAYIPAIGSSRDTVFTSTKIITTLNEKRTDSMEVFPSAEKEKSTITEILVNNSKSTIRKTFFISTFISTAESTYKYISSVGNIGTDHLPTTKTLNSNFSVKNYRLIDFYYLPVERIIRIFSVKKVLIDCLTNCSAQGKCASFDKNRYQCLCAKNYSGRECQIDLRPCKWNFCLNKGVCVMRAKKSYECLCGKDYYGSNCQFEVDVCKNETCSRHGYCYAKNFVPKCKCFYLYSGVKCEIESSELRVRKTVSKISSIVAVIVMVCFWLILVSVDVCSYMFFAPEKKAPSKKKEILIKPVYLN